MGLDTVELVMEVEEAFGIRIPDADAEQLVTVGQLHEYVVERMSRAAANRSPAPVCATARCFYCLRAALVETLGLDRQLVTPRAALASLLPAWNRRRQWRALQEKLEIRLPDLQRPAWLKALLVVSTFLVALSAAALTATESGVTAISLLFPLWIGLFFLGYIITEPMAVAVPVAVPTFGGLVRRTATLNHWFLLGDVPTLSRNEVWESLRSIIVEQLGVKPGDVRPEASFVKDLGCD